MDLALEMGCTVEELQSRMTERELHDWRTYSRRKRLPTRRLEHYLAGVMAMLSDGPVSLSRFLLFDPKPKEVEARDVVTPDDATQAVKAIFGGNVIPVGKRKGKVA